MSELNGVIVINKPQGFTSFDVVAVMRGATGQRKIGHLGTLDPNATGVLPLVLGSAAKAQELIANHNKGYTAQFQLGIKTDTLDIWGNELKRSDIRVSRAEAEASLKHFCGEIEQTPPMYSAVQVDGKRLYDLARQGKTVDRPKRTVTVFELELVDFDEDKQCGTLNILCSKGTYIRTIIDDLGEKLGTYAVMTSLVRTYACGFTLSDSIELEKARNMSDFSDVIKSTEELFAALRFVRLSELQSKRFLNGAVLDINRTPLKTMSPNEGELLRVKTPDSTFIGIARVKGEQLKKVKQFV